MANIQERGPYQFRVQVRRGGKSVSKTFETRREAEDWARITEGKVTGGEVVQKQTVASLAQACAWMEAHVGTNADARNQRGHIRYWKDSKFAAWAVSAIHDWDVIEWRREVLDEANAEDEGVGPEAVFGAQTCIHRMNALSKIIQTWARANKVVIGNPIKPGVRPEKPDGRSRRVDADEEARLLKVAEASSRPWLKAAIIIAIETAMRQGELVGLTWDRVKLDAAYPHADLLKTKNDRPRRVPLSPRAVAAFRSLDRSGPKPFPVLTTTGIVHAVRDAIGWDNFPDLRWHDLRHEAVSRLFEYTDLRDGEIMAISGHLSPTMLLRYTHLRADKLGERLVGGRLNQSPA